MARIHVTFEQTTEASRTDGDMSQHGWIHPQTEQEIKLAVRDDWRRARIRRHQAGEFRWPSLRSALEFLRDNATGPFRVEQRREAGYVTVRCDQDGPDVVMGDDGYEESDVMTSYEIHIACRPARAACLAEKLVALI